MTDVPIERISVNQLLSRGQPQIDTLTKAVGKVKFDANFFRAKIQLIQQSYCQSFEDIVCDASEEARFDVIRSVTDEFGFEITNFIAKLQRFKNKVKDSCIQDEFIEAQGDQLNEENIDDARILEGPSDSLSIDSGTININELKDLNCDEIKTFYADRNVYFDKLTPAFKTCVVDLIKSPAHVKDLLVQENEDKQRACVSSRISNYVLRWTLHGNLYGYENPQPHILEMICGNSKIDLMNEPDWEAMTTAEWDGFQVLYLVDDDINTTLEDNNL